MKRSRFSKERSIGVVKEHDSGAKVDEICRRHGISQATLYAWRKKYGGMEIADARRRKALEDENAKLKRIVADQAVDLVATKDLLAQNG